MGLVLASGAILGYAVYVYSGKLVSYETAIAELETNNAKLPGYNPLILNQFQTMADTIYSAGIVENKIETKPDRPGYGVYGISEHHLKVDRAEPYTIVTEKRNLNL